eukprot:3080739-Pleurochrysis_carterae.AAC.4
MVDGRSNKQGTLARDHRRPQLRRWAPCYGPCWMDVSDANCRSGPLEAIACEGGAATVASKRTQREERTVAKEGTSHRVTKVGKDASTTPFDSKRNYSDCGEKKFQISLQ